MKKLSVLFVLGPDDPEMRAIQEVLTTYNMPFTFAVSAEYERRTSYDAVTPPEGTLVELCGGVYPKELIFVECSWVDPPLWRSGVHYFDHHSPGDVGFYTPPIAYFAGSALGQVLNYLEKEEVLDINDYIDTHPFTYMIAAADHCLLSAYKGECPGVESEAFKAWCLSTRTRDTGINEASMLARIERAEVAIQNAPTITIGGTKVACFEQSIPELPEASFRTGIPIFSIVMDQRFNMQKVVLLGASATVITLWMQWAEHSSLVFRFYGNPNRNYAGAYPIHGVKVINLLRYSQE